MKNLIASYLLLLPLASLPQGPSFVWAEGSEGAGSDSGQSIYVDVYSYVYTTGQTIAGALLTKSDALGNLIFSIPIPSQFSSSQYSKGDFAVDQGGNIYFAGTFGGTVDFDPGTGNFPMTALGMADAFIAKLDSSGNFLWAVQFGAAAEPNFGDAILSIALDDAANIYVTGNFSNTVDFDPGPGEYPLTYYFFETAAFILKLNGDGEFMWATMFAQLTFSLGTSIEIDADGNVCSIGFFGGGCIDFDPGVDSNELCSVGQGDIYILKLTPNGDFLYAKNVAEVNLSNNFGIDSHDDGSVVVSGGFGQTVDFDPGVGEFSLSAGGANDTFFLKLDGDGNFLWAKAIEAAISGFSIDLYGGVLATGGFEFTMDFDPGTEVFNLSATGGSDIFLSKLDDLGNFVWAVKFGSTENDYSNSIAADEYGNICTTGSFQGTVDFDPETGTSNLTAVGLSDAFILKLLDCVSAGFEICDGQDNDCDGLVDEELSSGCDDPVACNYVADATCIVACVYGGCLDPLACNYNPDAVCDDGSCQLSACNDPTACNYDVNAICNDGSCVYNCAGCMVATACNYVDWATTDDGSCLFGNACWGCMDLSAVNYDGLAIYPDASCQYNSTAIVFYDLNINGTYETNEQGMASRQIHIPELNTTFFTNQYGFLYLSNLAAGTYTLQLINTDAAWTETNAPTQVVTVPNNAVLATFGLTPDAGVTAYDFGYWSSLNTVFCNAFFGFMHQVWIFNHGTTVLNGSISVDFDASLDYYVFPQWLINLGAWPPIVNPQQSTWPINQLLPGQGTHAYLWLTSPGSDMMGEILTFTTTLQLTDGEEIIANETRTESSEVLCSYDPNDKQAEPLGYDEPHFMLAGNEIEYTIRFQNTGNAPATNVRIEDMLDTALVDLATFQPVVGSHMYYTYLHEDGLVEFEFPDINLPDSTTNEPESHGLVKFRVSLKPGLAPETLIENTSSIFFDFNEPIVTNTVFHTIFDCTSFSGIVGETVYCEGDDALFTGEQDYVETYSWLMDDEEVSTDSTLELADLEASSFNIQLTTSNPLCEESHSVDVTVNPLPGIDITEDGSTLTAPDGASWQWYLDLEEIDGATNQQYETTGVGAYYVVTTNEFSCSVQSETVQIVSIDEAMSAMIAVYPNPVNDVLNILLPQGEWTIQLLNSVGEKVMVKSISTELLCQLPVGSLAAGQYIFIITSHDLRIQKQIPLTID